MTRYSSSLILLLVLSAQCDDIVPQDCHYEDNNHLSCHLTSINSRHERTDFSVISNQTVGLTVICSQSAMGELAMGAFSSLKMLQELSIDNCLLKDLPYGLFYGLENLKRLNIKTQNKVPLTVQPGAFNHLEALEALDLGQNMIRSLPAGEICKLGKLRSLNLSNNQISSLLDLGALDHCDNDLRTVDLSHNHLTGIEESPALKSWSHLEHLRIENNFVRFITENGAKGCEVTIM